MNEKRSANWDERTKRRILRLNIGKEKSKTKFHKSRIRIKEEEADHYVQPYEQFEFERELLRRR